MSFESQAYKAVGRTVQLVKMERVESEAGDRDVLTISFEDGSELVLTSADYEGYCSWIKEEWRDVV